MLFWLCTDYICFFVHYVCLFACIAISRYFLCAWVSILSSCCVVNCLSGKQAYPPKPPCSSQGSQQRSELRCQEGRFRDDNFPPTQTWRIFFTPWESYKHTPVTPRSTGRASKQVYLSLLCIFSLSIWPVFQLPTLSFFSVSFTFYTEEKTHFPSGVIKISHYHSDISQTDVGIFSVISFIASWLTCPDIIYVF